MNFETILEKVQADPALDLENVTQDAIRAVVAAERAHQASLVHYDGARPAELDDALLARVRENLLVDGGAEPVRRIGRAAEGVRELEHPYTLRGRAELDAVEDAPRPARAAKKTTAKKAAKKAPAARPPATS